MAAAAAAAPKAAAEDQAEGSPKPGGVSLTALDSGGTAALVQQAQLQAQQQAAATAQQATGQARAPAGQAVAGAAGQALTQQQAMVLAQHLCAAGLSKEQSIAMVRSACAQGLTAQQAPALVAQVRARATQAAQLRAAQQLASSGSPSPLQSGRAGPSSPASPSSPAGPSSPGGPSSPSGASGASNARSLLSPSVAASLAAPAGPVASREASLAVPRSVSPATPAPRTASPGAVAATPTPQRTAPPQPVATGSVAGASPLTNAADVLAISGPAGSQPGAALAQQALQQQQQFLMAQREEFQKNVVNVQKLVQAEASGMQQSQAAFAAIFKELGPKFQEPRLRGGLQQLHNLQGQVAQVHGMLEQQLATFTQAQAAAQETQLKLSQKHVGELFRAIQAMTANMAQTQRQVAELQVFKEKAVVAVNQITQQQNQKMQEVAKTTAVLQQKLAQSEQTQGQLRDKLTSQGGHADLTDVEVTELRQRVNKLEDEVMKLLGKDEWRFEEEEWV
mmetsp:Transcript_162527/g.520994  ORF Transcript_162527/g.520994 Transcript_162527/m.520994 type:complete len:507 (+) Transcript_162527:102-1622(+)